MSSGHDQVRPALHRKCLSREGSNRYEQRIVVLFNIDFENIVARVFVFLRIEHHKNLQRFSAVQVVAFRANLKACLFWLFNFEIFAKVGQVLQHHPEDIRFITIKVLKYDFFRL